MATVNGLNAEPDDALLLLAHARESDHCGGLPSKSVLYAARCLRISSFVFVVLAATLAVMAMSPSGVSGELEHGRWFIVCDVLLVPFLALWLIAWGIDKRYLWAWFVALLVFVVYTLTALTIFVAGINGSIVFVPFGILGVASLFTRGCRRDFWHRPATVR
jgi:hypothetical protein